MYEPSFAQQEAHAEDVSDVFKELVAITGYDSFCQRDMEVFYGDNYECQLADYGYKLVSDMTRLPEWEVRNIILDDICEVWHSRGVWYRRMNGMWKEFSRD